MSDQKELRVPTSAAGLREMHRRMGENIHTNIEMELLILSERTQHQEQIEKLLAQITPAASVEPPAADDPEPTPIKASGRARGG